MGKAHTTKGRTSKPSTRAGRLAVRVAGPADVKGIGRLLRRFRQEFGYRKAAAVPVPDGPNGSFIILLAERAGRAVGLLAAQRCYNLAQGSTFLLLSDIYVPTEERRGGVARALMGAVKQLAQQLGCQGMSLIVSEVNLPALTTAARAGFTRHDQLFFSYSDD
jgi:GNAT superfamily N-acetyltransferase